jgi:hypothetical protein
MKPAHETFWLYVLAVIAFVLVLIMSSADAAGPTRPLALDECGGMANDIRAFAVQRDEGVPEEVASKLVWEGAQPFIGKSESYLQTEADLHFLMELLHIVYTSPTLEPQELATQFYSACSAAALPKGLQT